MIVVVLLIALAFISLVVAKIVGPGNIRRAVSLTATAMILGFVGVYLIYRADDMAFYWCLIPVGIGLGNITGDLVQRRRRSTANPGVL